MRELTFELVYEEGVDPLMDMFIEFPTLSADSIASCIRRDRLWRIERFAGPTSALDTIERFKLNSNLPKEEMTATECGAIREHNVLERAPSTLALYTFVKRLHTCDSVLALAGRHLDLGVVFQTQRHGNSYEWRLLMRSEENVDTFYELIEENLDDGITLNIGRLGDAEHLSYNSLANVSIPDKQQQTLRAAIEHGYYETPREITVSELADLLDIPQSTVSYRLRQVEAQLAKGYIERFDDDLKAQVQ
ncbi:helix-turn-helix domain-containing protein [Salinibaculum salinum]|uniref:helix-turn-helix domain-containing protein n=1 Tax=Salinibaculum salinum TaxID=3131996 RepID=UPI0030EEE9F3